MFPLSEASTVILIRYITAGLGLIGFLLVWIIAVYGWRVYKKTHIPKAKKFSISFFLIGGGLLFSTLVAFLYLYDLKHAGLTEFSSSSLLSSVHLYTGFFHLGLAARVAGYILLAATLLNATKRTNIILGVIVFAIFLTSFLLGYMFLEGALAAVLAVIAALYTKKIMHKKSAKPFIAFSLLSFGSIFLFLAEKQLFLQLIGYTFKITGLSILFYYLYAAKGSVKGRVGEKN